MSSASDTATTPPSSGPSVFISYASEDRPAARLLRDTLEAAGLEVWYDESELGGGDAWDQKIRRQIRDCEYFIPVISAATEARKEGYFRREWRLATERTLDMADDVLFLIPVSIDETSEVSARVPDKFLHVQWLRLPGGKPTPALDGVIRRMLAGDHHALTRAPWGTARPSSAAPMPGTPPPLATGTASAASDDAPPQMPPFPHPPEKGGFGHTLRFLAEAFWWLLTAAWLLFKRLPKWARVIVGIWLLFSALSTCTSKREKTITIGDTHDADTKAAIRAAAEQLAQSAREARKNRNPADLARIGNDIARNFGPGGPGGPDGPGQGRHLVMVPFSRTASEDPDEKFGSAVFASLYGQLTLAHAREVGLARQLQADATDEAVIARAKQLGATFVLTGHVTGVGDARALAVRVLVTADGSTKWSESFLVANAEPSDVADKIADHIIPVLPARREPSPAQPPQIPQPPK